MDPVKTLGELDNLIHDLRRWTDAPLEVPPKVSDIHKIHDQIRILFNLHFQWRRCCPRCGREYRFEEEIKDRLCAPCVVEISEAYISVTKAKK